MYHYELGGVGIYRKKPVKPAIKPVVKKKVPVIAPKPIPTGMSIAMRPPSEFDDRKNRPVPKTAYVMVYSNIDGSSRWVQREYINRSGMYSPPFKIAIAYAPGSRGAMEKWYSDPKVAMANAPLLTSTAPTTITSAPVSPSSAEGSGSSFVPISETIGTGGPIAADKKVQALKKRFWQRIAELMRRPVKNVK